MFPTNRFLLMMSMLALCPTPLTAQQPKGAVTIDQRVRAAIQGFRGNVSLYAKNLDTGQSYGLQPDDPVPTASTIKLPIMVELFAQADGEKARLESKA